MEPENNLTPYHRPKPIPTPPDDAAKAIRNRRLRIIAAMERAGFMSATAFASHYRLSRTTVTKFLLGISDSLDVAAALRDIGFNESRTKDGQIRGLSRKWQHRPPATELGRAHFGHLFAPGKERAA